MEANRFEIFTRLMGGEEHLPPRLPTPPQARDEATNDCEMTDFEDDMTAPRNLTDAFGNLHVRDLDDYLTSTDFPAPSAPAYDNRHNQQSTQPPAVKEYSTEQDFTLDPHKGEPSARGMSFCSFLALSKFPYKYVDPEFLQQIATAFFDQNKFYNRDWDIYYALSDQLAKPVTFIPLSQAQTLVDEVNAAFPSLNWEFAAHHEETGLLLTFDHHNPAHRPRFLGHTSSRGQYDFFVENIDPYNHDQDMAPHEDHSAEAYKEQVALAAEAGKNKSKKMKQERQQKTVFKRQTMGKQLLQAQRFLGLRGNELSDSLPDLADVAVSPFDVDLPTAHPCESDVIIISIDVESYEKAHGIITEVGVSTLDTRDLQGTAPGACGEGWQQFVRGRHFRVTENVSYKNKQYVYGCPEEFRFGKSEFVSLKDMPSTLTKCFHEPFSKPIDDTNANAQEAAEEDPQQRRNIVLLGHDIEQDIQYCHRLGFSVLGRGNLIATLDTKAMYQAYTRDHSPRGLGGVLHDFGFAAWSLHNAGNDAAYTVWAMLATCVQDRAERNTDEAKKRQEERTASKLEAALEQAKERVRDESEGWDLVSDDDGGVAVTCGPAAPSLSGHYTMGGEPLDI
ncbi:hypothetical protein Q7P37_004235 [Cladosporium fusiforme]